MEMPNLESVNKVIEKCKSGVKEACDTAKAKIQDMRDEKLAAIASLEAYYENISEGISDLDRLKAHAELSDGDVQNILNTVPEYLRGDMTDYEVVSKYYRDYLKHYDRAPRVSIDDTLNRIMQLMQGSTEDEKVLVALKILKM